MQAISRGLKSNRNTSICASFGMRMLNSIFEIPYSPRIGQLSANMKKQLLSKYSAKWLESLIIHGRVHDSMEHLQTAIDLGSLTARADMALLCYNMKLQWDKLRTIFDLLDDGVKQGCKDCEGMLAFYIITNSGTDAPDYHSAYDHAIESADAGSVYGKFALAHFLDFYMKNYAYFVVEDDIYIFPSDKFICNFFNEDDFDDEDFDCDISEYQKIRIVKSIVTEIQQEHQRNPTMPKVWLKLPAL